MNFQHSECRYWKKCLYSDVLTFFSPLQKKGRYTIFMLINILFALLGRITRTVVRRFCERHFIEVKNWQWESAFGSSKLSKKLQKNVKTKSSDYVFFEISPKVHDIVGISKHRFIDPLIAQRSERQTDFSMSGSTPSEA